MKARGLGHQFLKHAERTKILVHVIDMSGSEGRDPIDDYNQICEELDLYSEELLQKHRILVANKMDLPDAKKNLTRFKRKVTKDIIAISAQEKEGLDKLLDSDQIIAIINKYRYMTRTFQRPIKRIVVKLGSSQIADSRMRPKTAQLSALCQTDQSIAQARH